jgi:hypothetical protein
MLVLFFEICYVEAEVLKHRFLANIWKQIYCLQTGDERSLFKSIMSDSKSVWCVSAFWSQIQNTMTDWQIKHNKLHIIRNRIKKQAQCTPNISFLKLRNTVVQTIFCRYIIWCRFQWPWVCGRSLAGIVESNPAGCMDVLFVANIVCCQVEAPASGWSLVQSIPTECDVSECGREASIMRRPWPTRDCCAMEKDVIW